MKATKSEFGLFMARLASTVPRFAPDLKNPQTLELWYKELEDLTTDDLSLAYKTIVRGSDQFPSIREVRAAAKKAERSNEDKAREVAELIWNTLEDRKSMGFDLLSVLGPIGAEVVKRQGGWWAICEIATYDNAATLKAQWRGLAEVLLRKQDSGEAMDSVPQFTRLPAQHADAIKKLADKFTP